MNLHKTESHYLPQSLFMNYAIFIHLEAALNKPNSIFLFKNHLLICSFRYLFHF